MQQGMNVSHLVAKVLHAGVPGGHDNMRPVVWDRGDAGMTFQLVQYDRAYNVLGQVDHVYRDVPTLIREISEAFVKWGHPTAEKLAEAFPNGNLKP